MASISLFWLLKLLNSLGTILNAHYNCITQYLSRDEYTQLGYPCPKTQRPGKGVSRQRSRWEFEPMQLMLSSSPAARRKIWQLPADCVICGQWSQYLLLRWRVNTTRLLRPWHWQNQTKICLGLNCLRLGACGENYLIGCFPGGHIKDSPTPRKRPSEIMCEERSHIERWTAHVQKE